MKVMFLSQISVNCKAPFLFENIGFTGFFDAVSDMRIKYFYRKHNGCLWRYTESRWSFSSTTAIVKISYALVTHN